MHIFHSMSMCIYPRVSRISWNIDILALIKTMSYNSYEVHVILSLQHMVSCTLI